LGAYASVMGRGVNRVWPGWRVGARLLVCAVLLLWIGQVIFSREAESLVRGEGGDWAGMSAAERWQSAWTRGPRQLLGTLALLDTGGLALSVVFMGATVFLGVWRWRMVLRVQGLGLPFGRAFVISLIAQFFNAFLLGSTGGDLIKAYYAARETHHKKTEAVVTVLADRLIGLLSMLLFAGLMMLVNLKYLTAHPELTAVAGVVAAMLVGCTGVVLVSFWGGMSRLWPASREWLRRLPKAGRLEEALEAFRHFGRDGHFLRRAFGASALLNLACVLQVMALGRGLGIEVPWMIWLVIVPSIICISALPITPSGLGVRENLYVLTLAGPGLQVPATQALAVSLLAYFGFLLWSLVGGAVYVLVRRRHHLDEVTSGGTEPGE